MMKDVSRWPVWALSIAIGLTLATPTVGAQVVKRGTPNANASPLTLAAGLATAVGEGLSQPSGPGDSVAGIAKPLHAIFSNTYESNAAVKGRVIAKYRGYQQSFDARWAEVQARRNKVAVAVDRARALAKAKKYDAARAELVAVVTGASVDDAGEVVARGDVLLAMDAELPALYELAAIARDAKDPYSLPDIAAALRPRRRLLADTASESYVWMAQRASEARRNEEGNTLGSFSAGMPAAIGRALERIESARTFLAEKDGMLMAQGFFHQQGAYGLPLGDVSKQSSATIGGYVLFELVREPGVRLDVRAKDVVYEAKIQQSFAVNCHETDKIDGYDPVSKKFSYRKECDNATRRYDVTLGAALRTAPPAWSQAGGRLWVIGKVKTASVKDDGKTLRARWTLTEAEVVDYRFLGAMTIVDFGDAAATIF